MSTDTTSATHGRSALPLPWQEWDRNLAFHLDQHFRAYIVEGLRHGFRVGFNYDHNCQKSLRNMPSALEHPQVLYFRNTQRKSVVRVVSWALCSQPHSLRCTPATLG